MPLTAETVLQMLEAQSEKLRSFGVLRIGVFGSTARGEARADSDLDFLVELGDFDGDMYFDLLDFLEELFGREVDVVTPAGIRPELQHFILPEVRYAKVI